MKEETRSLITYRLERARESLEKAKSAFGYIAIKQMGYSGREVGRFLNMRSYGAIRRPARFAFVSENNLYYDSSRMIIMKMAYPFCFGRRGSRR